MSGAFDGLQAARWSTPSLRSAARSVGRDESAATMIEYALMLAMIALACYVAVRLLGTSTSGFFTDAAARMSAAGS